MSTWIKENFSFQDLQRIMFRLIERVDVFAGMTQKDLLQLLETAEKCTFEAGEQILREGSSGAFLYVIIEGKVSVLKSAGQQGSTELAQLSSGDSFGEMSLIDQEVRSASVIAIEPCLLLRLSEAACDRQPATSAPIYRNIARILSKRLREMDHNFVVLSRRPSAKQQETKPPG